MTPYQARSDSTRTDQRDAANYHIIIIVSPMAVERESFNSTRLVKRVVNRCGYYSKRGELERSR